MQRKFVRTDPGNAVTNARPSPRHLRFGCPNKGFFTFGFAIAVLAASALGGGIIEAVAPASGSWRSTADVDPLLPIDHTKVESARAVTVGGAAAQVAHDSRSSGEVLR